MRTYLRGKVTLLFIVLGMLLAIPAIALADTLVIQNDLNVNANATHVPGDTGTANVVLNVTNGTPTGYTNGCNANGSNPLTATLSSNNPDVTFPSGNTATITGCGVAVPVTYKVSNSATAPGTAVISASVSGGVPSTTSNPRTYDTSDTLTINITPPPNTAPATTNPTFNPASPKTNDTLQASTTTSDVDNNNVSVAWVWKVTRSGNTCQVSTDTSAAAAPGVRTSSLDLSQSYTTTNCTGANPGTINPSKGDTVVVEATPNDGTVNGTMRSSSVVIANSAPACAAVSLTTNEEATGIANPSCTDADGDTLTYSIVDQGTKGTASVTGGQLQYEPNANENGSDSFTYKTNDGTAFSDPATVNVTINPVNDEPSFTAGGNVTVNEDSGAYSAAWATGISAGPANENGQTVSFNVSNDHNALFSTQPAISSSGTLTFTPEANAFGTATVSVYAQDSGGTANGGDDTTATQTFTITVNAVNDAPSFTKGADQTVLENSGLHTVTGWATGISAGPNNESGQVVDFIVSTNNDSLFTATGKPAIDASGNLTYTLAQNAIGTATVSVQAHDNGGTANGGDDTSDPQTFTIDVNYDFAGFLQPINWTAHQVLDTNVSTFKLGSTVPVKFQLKDANGNVVQAASAQWITPQKGSATSQAVDETVYSEPATNGTLYKWDATAQQYIYNWSTKGSQSGFYYKIGVKLDDGNTYYTYISLR